MALWVLEPHYVLERTVRAVVAVSCTPHLRAVMGLAKGSRAKTSCQTGRIGGAGTCPASVISCHPTRPSEQFRDEMSVISVGRMEETAPWIKCLQ